MKRYERFVYEDERGIFFEVDARKGIIFEVLEETRGKLFIKARNVAAANVCSENYANPPIPRGYGHVCGEWNNGFVIERYTDGSQFVWVPVESLDSNGNLFGFLFNEKFGRRNYLNNEFSKDQYHEEMTYELELQFSSVRKYGGFYISRYNISRSSTGKPQSIKGVMPWVYINFEKAKEVAAIIEDNETVKSHLTFGAEYDSVLEWFIKSNARTRSEIVEDSTNWGNYYNTKNAPGKVVETGSNEEWCTNNICDFTGNVCEWTQEQKGNSSPIIRGGSFDCDGKCVTVANRFASIPYYYDMKTSFRAALYIK